MQFIQLKESLKTKIHPIYLCKGSDAFSLKKAVELFKASLITMPEVNCVQLYGDDLQAEKLKELIDCCTALPFLESRRLIIVKNFNPSTKDFNAYCKSYFENPLESTVLVIVNDDAVAGKKGTEKAGAKKRVSHVDLQKQANVTFVSCEKLLKTDILKAIARIATKESITIETEAADCLIEYTMGDMLRIENELYKLIGYVGNVKYICKQDVQDMVMAEFDYKVYELSNAFALKQYNIYLNIQNDLLQKGVDCLGILNILLRHYQILLNIQMLQKPNTQTAEALGLKTFAVQKYKEQIALLGEEQVYKHYKWLVRAVNNFKCGIVSQDVALTQVLAKIFYQ